MDGELQTVMKQIRSAISQEEVVIKKEKTTGNWNRFRMINCQPKETLALLETCNVTNKGRHLGDNLGFYQELEIRLKPREMVIFCAWHEK